MNSDKQSKLPEYVGKKIVEALKQENTENTLLEDIKPTFTQHFTQNTSSVSSDKNITFTFRK